MRRTPMARDFLQARNLARALVEQCDHCLRLTAEGHDDDVRAINVHYLAHQIRGVACRMVRRFERLRAAVTEEPRR